jgi:hypothetical protein
MEMVRCADAGYPALHQSLSSRPAVRMMKMHAGMIARRGADHEVGVIARAAKEIAERRKCHTVDRARVPTQCIKQMPFLNIPHLSLRVSTCNVFVISANTLTVESELPLSKKLPLEGCEPRNTKLMQ